MSYVSYVQLLGATFDLGTYPSEAEAMARACSVLPLLSEPAAACARRGDAPDAELGADLGRALCGILPKDLQRRRNVVTYLWRAQIAVAAGEKRERRRRSAP